MRLSAALLKDLKRHEGFRARPYLCTAGQVTIGYGHNLEAHPDSILLFPEMGEECSDARMEAATVVREVKAGNLRGRALLDKLLALGVEWNESEAALRLEQDVIGLESSMTTQCAAYRHLVNASAATEAGRTMSANACDGAGVRADVVMNMAFNLGVLGVLKFRKMHQAILADDYDTAAAEMLNSRWSAQVKGRAVELARRMRSGVREEVATSKVRSVSTVRPIRGMSMDSASVTKKAQAKNGVVTVNAAVFSAGFQQDTRCADVFWDAHSAVFAPPHRGGGDGGLGGGHGGMPAMAEPSRPRAVQ